MISVQNLNKKFDARGIAGVHDLNFTLNEGEVIALMGPNGSGKTTLLNLIAGVIKPDQGLLKIDGVVKIHSSVIQNEYLNIQKFLESKVTIEVDQEKKIQLARDFADLFEFTSQLKQELHQVSAGQKQKVLLAGELINNPKLLLLDEPFTHLDPFTRRDILKNLFRVIKQQGITLIWVTHDLHDALKFSDRMMLLNFGRIEQHESPFQMLRHPKNLFVAQFLGFENFFPIKKEASGFKTPWGIWNHEFNLNEAFLVVPNSAWHLSETSFIKAKVMDIYPRHQTIEVVAEWEGKNIIIEYPITSDIPKEDTILSLQPILKKCFIIPL